MAQKKKNNSTEIWKKLEGRRHADCGLIFRQEISGVFGKFVALDRGSFLIALKIDN